MVYNCLMRTNINLDDDVHQFARTYAAAKGISLSAAVSELLRRAESTQPQPPKISRSKVTGLAAFPSTGRRLTSEMVREAESELD
jgi:plasmid stability protein